MKKILAATLILTFIITSSLSVYAEERDTELPRTSNGETASGSVRYKYDHLFYAVGQQFKYKPKLTNKSERVSYSSSNEGIASVDSDGQVTCLSVGSARITATTESGTASYYINVTKQNPTFADKINVIKPKSSNLEAWESSLDDFAVEYASKMLESGVVKENMTNYQKLRAAYDYIWKNVEKDTYNCVGYAYILGCAFESLGYETYHMRGETKRAGGGWTVHSWVGIDVGGKLYYFDANLPGQYGNPADKYFAVPAKDATFYQDAQMNSFHSSFDIMEILESMM